MQLDVDHFVVTDEEREASACPLCGGPLVERHAPGTPIDGRNVVGVVCRDCSAIPCGCCGVVSDDVNRIGLCGGCRETCAICGPSGEDVNENGLCADCQAEVDRPDADDRAAAEGTVA
jgi:hypothetical protein